MNNLIGKFVKILLATNVAVEGVVKEWGNQVILKSLEEKINIVIFRPAQDIVLIKVYENLPYKNNKENIIEDKTIIKENNLKNNLNKLQNNFINKTNEISSKDILRTKKLVELKEVLNQQEKEIVTSKLQDHYLDPKQQKAVYERPGFFFKK